MWTVGADSPSVSAADWPWGLVMPDFLPVKPRVKTVLARGTQSRKGADTCRRPPELLRRIANEVRGAEFQK